jgi:hypothetical protein
MEPVLLTENNYLEWEAYIRNELLARGLWDIVQGIRERPQKPAVPKSASSTTTAATGGAKRESKDGAEDDFKSGSAAAIRKNAQAMMVSETTPESDEVVYMRDFRQYLVRRENYIKDVGKTTAEIRRSLHPSFRKRYNEKLYDSAPTLLWQVIEKDYRRVANIDAYAGLYKLNAIRREDFESATAYHSQLLDIATELRFVGTELSEDVLAFFMMQGLPTGDVWLSFKCSLTATGKDRNCRDILEQLQVFELLYSYDRHGASAYTNTESSNALFAKKGAGGGSKKKDGKASGGDRSSSKTIKCFGCGKKGHKKFECRSKHLWKENSAKKESSKEKVFNDAPAPTATDASVDFVLLLGHAEEPEEPLMLRQGADEVRESVSTNRSATSTAQKHI